MNDTANTGRRSFALVALIGVAAAVLWFPPLRSSLWMDETVTHWITGGGVSKTIDRAAEFEGESPLYFLIVAATRRVIGSSELALRLPSLIAIAAATYLVWRLGRRLLDSETGAIAAVVFVATPVATFAAADARSYGLALFAVVASTLMLVRWVDSRSKFDAAGYVLLTALALYLHYFTAAAIAAHLVYAWMRRDRIGPRRFFIVLASVGLLMTPALPQLRALIARRGMLELPHDVSLELFFEAIVPSLLLGAAAFGLLIARLIRPFTLAPNDSDERRGGILALALWLVPPAVLAILTLLGVRVFEGRYLFFAAPGLALAVAVALRRVADHGARFIVAVAIAVAALITLTSTSHTADDWPAAVSLERRLATDQTPVLVRSTLVESANLSWLSRPDKREYLLAPLSVYPIRGRVILLPHSVTDSTIDYLERNVVPQLLVADRFILLNDNGTFAPWLEGRFDDRARRDRRSAGVTVTLFARRS